MTRPVAVLSLSFSLMVLGLGLAGCPGDVEYDRVFPAGCDSEPVFLLLSPNPAGTTVTTGDLLMQLDIGVFEIVDKQGQAPEPCEGHLHVRLDDGGATIVTDDTHTFDVHDLGDGEHVIHITVHNNDHSRIEEIDEISATFTLNTGTN